MNREGHLSLQYLAAEAHALAVSSCSRQVSTAAAPGRMADSAGLLRRNPTATSATWTTRSIDTHSTYAQYHMQMTQVRSTTVS
jgi:hypothetical protein